jgi:acetylornithine deacetylase/succinyl-diaminopimelate desuccinylase
MEKNDINIEKFVTLNELVELTSQLIKIPSYSGLINQEQNVALYIYDFIKDNNIDVELIEVLKNRYNVIAKIRGCGSGRSLMLTGHMDTVPAYDMSISPFSGEIKNGNVYGRGSCDMKGPLASMIMALVGIKRSGIKLKGDLIFAAVINEEQTSEGTEYIVRNGPKTDAAIVGEPTNMEIAAGHRGLEWLKIKIKGKTTHGGTSNQGINAISKAAKLITEIENNLIPKMNKKNHWLIGPPTLNFGKIYGGDQPSTVAGECSIELDRRWIPSENYEQLFNDFYEIFDKLKKEDQKFDAELTRIYGDVNMMVHKPMEIDINDTVVKCLETSLFIVNGVNPPIVSFPAWTDASLLSNYAKIPTVVFGPGILAKAHSKEEYIEIEQLYKALQVYAITAINYCN